MAAVELSGLRFSYGENPVVNQLSLSLPEGRLVGLMGANASGKTTLLKLIAGILKPARGEVLLFGKPVATLPQPERARTVAYVPQEFAPAFPFTVREVALLGRSMLSPGFFYETAEDLRLADEALTRVGVAHKAQASVFHLSGGEKQLLSVARALAQRPRVLLLDEPSSFLDVGHKVQIFTLLKKLAHDDGLAVLVVTHDLFFAYEFDWIVTLRDGGIYSQGGPGQILTMDTIGALYGVQLAVERTPQGVVFRLPS